MDRHKYLVLNMMVLYLQEIIRHTPNIVMCVKYWNGIPLTLNACIRGWNFLFTRNKMTKNPYWLRLCLILRLKKLHEILISKCIFWFQSTFVFTAQSFYEIKNVWWNAKDLLRFCKFHILKNKKSNTIYENYVTKIKMRNANLNITHHVNVKTKPLLFWKTCQNL